MYIIDNKTREKIQIRTTNSKQHNQSEAQIEIQLKKENGEQREMIDRK
jgi:hypothetical protein